MTIPAGWGQVAWAFTGDAAPLGAMTTIGFQNGAEETADQLAENFWDGFVATILPELSSSLNLVSCLVKLGPDSTGASAVFTGFVSGTGGGEPIAPNTAILVSKNTALGGRRGRGRMYIPGLPLGNYGTGGFIDPGALTSLQTEVTGLGALATLGSTPFAVLHDGPTAPTLITSLTVQAQLATQRRRLRD